jgi:hypothetical protein
MRKLAWFVAIVLLISLAIAIAAHISEDFKIAVVYVLTAIGGTVWITASGAWSNFAMIIGSSGTYFFIFTILVLIVGWQLLGRTLTLVRNQTPFKKKQTGAETPEQTTFSTEVRSTTPANATSRPVAEIKPQSPPPTTEESTEPAT